MRPASWVGVVLPTLAVALVGCPKKAEPVASDPAASGTASVSASASETPAPKPAVAYAPIGVPGIHCPATGGTLGHSGGDPLFVMPGGKVAPTPSAAPSSSGAGLSGAGALSSLGAVFGGPGGPVALGGIGFGGYRARGTSGLVMVADKLDDKKAGAVACTALPLFRACHAAGGKDGARHDGIVDVALEVGAKGEVVKAVVSTSGTLTDPTVVECVRASFTKLTFDPPTGAPAGLGYRVWLEKDPKPLQVKDAGVTVGKGLPPEVVRRILRSNLPRISKCYDLALDKDPKLAGELAVDFTVDATGATSGAKLAATSAVTAPDLAKCVTDLVSKVSFPQPEGTTALAVTAKWTLAPTRETQ